MMATAIRISLLRCFPGTQARDEHNEHADEEQDHSCKTGPHPRGVVGVRHVVAVNVVFDDLFSLVS